MKHVSGNMIQSCKSNQTYSKSVIVCTVSIGKVEKITLCFIYMLEYEQADVFTVHKMHNMQNCQHILLNFSIK